MKSQESAAIMLTAAQKSKIRSDLVESAKKLIGVPYKFGSEWTNYSLIPKYLDCSEMCEGIYTLQKLICPDGSQNQWDYFIDTPAPQPGDLAFFGRGGRPSQIYHVGMMLDQENIIEARAFDPEASFETGKVILRPIEKWKAYPSFVGFRCHPKLL